ncbi:dihydrolipoyllysine-residue succinyltransferase component of 2-oxoglutarate dehydrogenase complex [Thalassobaculum fulvum]|uniref:Dihydrolipoyllysine-residue succinyltransferase component of 2-oxoglutarate dehydrogenase complex n=1 Tax=Thalassobaculum fulvum TaxID=1633335 RepID=A0A918XWZ7_9PROT|nr:2-oxoglutarate dehydrogenase complex dihydrolipoyllysine-residue succinyltransferase [Thalassobaculum fulvum]GHD59567.1 dihydrolipoyllysine-residue succinyltransferase component of 2-oxoglutarate dehydrogenase complex [Thalassobaculum fulvum]
MATQITVPALGESVSEATVAKWMKAAGDAVQADEPLVELETDKVTLEVNAPASGVLIEIAAKEGAEVEVGALLGTIDETAKAAAKKPEAPKETPKEAPKAAAPAEAPKEAPKPAAPAPAPAAAAGSHDVKTLSPAVRKLVEDNDLDPSKIKPTGKDGRLVKEDVQKAIEAGTAKRTYSAAPAAGASPAPAGPLPPRPEDPREERVKMTRLRQAIARRLKDAQNTAAMLTTFNEVDMTNVMALRAEYKDVFEKKHGVKLGFMSFFVKAAIAALQELPAVNAEIYGDEIVYKNFYDIGVAVGTPQGLVVPIVRDADQLSFAGVEKAINELGVKARDGKLSLAEMQGGTFTISNGGVYGSLMSTPILNPPQSGILGMHKIQQRPMAVGKAVEIRPMMYLALSYDHRIVDGREAVTFLVRIKDAIEDPRRLLLDL